MNYSVCIIVLVGDIDFIIPMCLVLRLLCKESKLYSMTSAALFYTLCVFIYFVSSHACVVSIKSTATNNASEKKSTA